MKPIFSFLFSVLFLSCQSVPVKEKEEGVLIGSHSYKVLKTPEGVESLQVRTSLDPQVPPSLLKTIPLKLGEGAKMARLFEWSLTLKGEEARLFEEDFNHLLELIEQRNLRSSEENEFEVALLFGELLPQE